MNRLTMDLSRLTVLQAASRILNGKRRDRKSVETVSAYARQNIPDKASLPDDELATVVALNLLDVEGDPTKKPQ